MAWRDQAFLPQQQPSFSLFASSFINVSLYLYTFISKAAPHCRHVSLFLSGSSTGSVFGLDCRGAQGGSALTVGGNSFRKYQTSRHTLSHTQSTISLSFLVQAELTSLHKVLRRKPSSPLSLSQSHRQKRSG